MNEMIRKTTTLLICSIFLTVQNSYAIYLTQDDDNTLPYYHLSTPPSPPLSAPISPTTPYGVTTDKINSLIGAIKNTSEILNGTSSSTTTNPAEETTTQNFVLYQPPDSPNTVLPVSIQEKDDQYVLYLPYQDPVTGEVSPFEFKIPKEGTSIDNNILVIKQIKIDGCTLQDIRIDLATSSIQKATFLFEDTTKVEMENGQVTEYSSPYIKNLKDLLSNTTDADGNAYYTPAENEDSATLTEKLRQSYLKLQYDLLSGNIELSNFPESELSFQINYIDSNNEVTPISISYKMLSTLASQGLIKFTPEGEQQLNISVAGIQIPYSYSIASEDNLWKILSACAEKGILDNEGNISVTMVTENGEKQISVPFAFLFSDKTTFDSDPEINTALTSLQYGILELAHLGNIITPLGDLSFDETNKTFVYGQFHNLSQNKLDSIQAILKDYGTSTFSLPKIGSESMSAGIIDQFLQQASNQNDYRMRDVMSTIGKTAANDITKKLQELQACVENGDTQDGYQLMDEINHSLEEAMKRTNLAFMAYNYSKQIKYVGENSTFTPELLNYSICFDKVLTSLAAGKWEDAFNEVKSSFPNENLNTAIETGSITQLDKILNTKKQQLAIRTGAKAFISVAALSALSMYAGAYLATTFKSMVETVGVLRKAAAMYRASRIAKLAGSVMRGIIKVGNFFDDLTEFGLSMLGRPGALISSKMLSGFASYALRIGINASVAGYSSYKTAKDPNNKLWRFINNPLGFILPITQQAGNLGDICEFLSLAIDVYRGESVKMPRYQTASVTPYSTKQGVNITTLFQQAHQGMKSLLGWMETLGITAPGLTISIEGFDPIIDQETKKTLELSYDQEAKLMQLNNDLYTKLGKDKEATKLFFNKYINYLKTSGLKSADVVTAFSNIIQYVNKNTIQSVDNMATIHLYASTMYNIDQTFNLNTDTSNIENLNKMKKFLKTQATRALSLYINRTQVKSPFSKHYKAIALRALQEIDMITSYLQQVDRDPDSEGKKFGTSLQYNGEKFVVQKEVLPSTKKNQARYNTIIDESYIESAKIFAKQNGINWNSFIKFVEANLTDTNAQASHAIASRFSFRFDLPGTNMVTLDITSPYIVAMNYLAGKEGDYHQTFIHVNSEKEFMDFVQRLLTIFNL